MRWEKDENGEKVGNKPFPLEPKLFLCIEDGNIIVAPAQEKICLDACFNRVPAPTWCGDFFYKKNSPAVAGLFLIIYSFFSFKLILCSLGSINKIWKS